ncbi:arginine decarboxylase [Salmonella enterica subsp. enterica]|uniref:Arginine decarboxylase n=1 Tax=Salmonella enterica I TaxID=59201 RepID=A0A447TPJ9_SALET|nr:arginine decarboxylase [Salmonella enterica subsp. enterica]
MGGRRDTRAASVSLKRLPVAFITIIMAKTCSAAIWGLSVPRSVHSSTIPARLAKARKNAARVFGADRSWSVVVGTSGSNRTIMQACMTDNDVVVLDRNCHKSIEQGLILTGAKPVYMVPSRNRYGIIGPIYPQEMQPENLAEKNQRQPADQNQSRTETVLQRGDQLYL